MPLPVPLPVPVTLPVQVSSSTRPHTSNTPSRRSLTKTTRPSATAITTANANPAAPLPIRSKYADCKLGPSVTVTTTTVPASPSSASSISVSDSDGRSDNTDSEDDSYDSDTADGHQSNSMSKGRTERRLSTSSSKTVSKSSSKSTSDSPRQSKTSTNSTSASSPVQIPRQSSRTGTNRDKHHASQRRRAPRHIHSPDAVSPSVAALLAMTDIPRHRSSASLRQKRKTDPSLTVKDIVRDQHVSEKELSISLAATSPLDVLLSPPDDIGTEDDMSTCESPDGSSLQHTISYDSVPSLGDSYATDPISSLDSASYFSRPRRTRSPARKSLEPVRSPPSLLSDKHPLSINMDDDEYPVRLETIEEPAISVFAEPFRPLKAAFKSNLTASLRALRSAAKTFSTLNFPSLPPDDLLSRSILTIDPNVPYTDERRPPVTEEMPSAELRRYLNPATRPLETQPQDGPQRPRLASIQMQTYKVHRSRVSPSRNPPSALPYAASASATSTTGVGGGNGGSASQKPDAASQQQATPMLPAAMRQREMRENPDFIRIAVMEMAMRKRGKLDDRKPGRARWALPPRKAPIKSTDAEEIGPNGVPTRWIPITYEQ